MNIPEVFKDARVLDRHGEWFYIDFKKYKRVGFVTVSEDGNLWTAWRVDIKKDGGDIRFVFRYLFCVLFDYQSLEYVRVKKLCTTLVIERNNVNDSHWRFFITEDGFKLNPDSEYDLAKIKRTKDVMEEYPEYA